MSWEWPGWEEARMGSMAVISGVEGEGRREEVE